MNKLIVCAAVAVVAVAPVAGAQESVVTGKPSVFHITPYVGYVAFGDHFEFSDGTEYTNSNAALFGGQVGLDVSRYASIVGNFGYSKTSFEFERDVAGTTNDFESRIDGVGVFLYDANLHLKVPVIMGMTALSPFIQGGVGQIKFSEDTDDIRGNGASNIAYNVGIGTDFQVRGLGLRLMAKDYISSFAWDDLKSSPTGSTNNFQNIKDASISHNWAFSLGLKFGF